MSGGITKVTSQPDYLIYLTNLTLGNLGWVKTNLVMLIFLSYPWFADTLFLCSCALPYFPPLLEFGTAHANGDVAIPTPTFPFPLTSPSYFLIGKEQRLMALPAKSWPSASEDWII